jgi:hypothetical protein
VRTVKASGWLYQSIIGSRSVPTSAVSSISGGPAVVLERRD